MQERRNSSALAMELRLSCINPLIYTYAHYAGLNIQDVLRSLPLKSIVDPANNWQGLGRVTNFQDQISCKLKF